ncbi:hypothetical protein [Rhodoplanes sp. Z2-YC6860]|uniref:hypothetical protein n=1 Tax=Rhodoplanes sp. Z2-YC6860 TaxID=674703 RepID=UPI0012ED0F79|nr:hypothetical protein [Rhodoplanes sp. Z2-YC6860]
MSKLFAKMKLELVVDGHPSSAITDDAETLLFLECSVCAGTCRLAGIEPAQKRYDYLYTYECRDCGEFEVKTVRMQ